MESRLVLDSSTVILFALFVKVLLAALFFGFLYRSRRSVWFAWWGATFLLGSLSAAIFLMQGFAGRLSSVGVGSAVLMLAFGSCWHGVRAFEGRAPLWSVLFAAPLTWLTACLIPGFLENTLARVLLSSTLIAPLIAMAGVELWRGRGNEELPSRRLTAVLFFSFAAVFAVRIPLAGIAPLPFGALPPEPVWMAVFNMLMFFHTAGLAVLLVALTKERREVKERTAADTDPLTGVWNRRGFTSLGARLLTRHERKSEELCLLFLDLDDFKSLNDRLGHPGGDEVLKRFVEIVQLNIRPEDFLFRIGGEEFCCLLPRTNVLQGQQVAERIRRQVEQAVLDIGGQRARTTVSIGVASTAICGYESTALLKAADAAVYTAKREGRNRVAVAGRHCVAGETAA